MSNSTFTWTATGASATPWTTTADWSPNPVPGNFTAPPGIGPSSDFVINGSNSLDLTGFGGGNQSVDGLTVTDANAALHFTGSPITIANVAMSSGTFVATSDGGQLTIGNANSAGTFQLSGTFIGGSSDGGPGYTVDGSSLDGTATLTGSGVVDDTAGILTFGANISVAAGQSITFEVGNTASAAGVLVFEGDVNSGVVDFTASDGELLSLEGTQVGAGDTLVNGGTFGAVIEGLAAGSNSTLENGIDIATGIVDPGEITGTVVAGTGGNSILELTDAHSNTYSFNLSGNYVGDTVLTQSDSNIGGVDVYLMAVCFAAGTSILTESGETAIESIEPGDSIITAVDGAFVPRTVKWVGHRDFVIGQHPRPEEIAPVRVMQGALGDNLPRRDLLLSGDHCLFLDGRLYPAKLLINGMTIIRDLSLKAVSYHHIELEDHAVMLAEGVAAETYLDTGNRAFFSNAGVAMMLHPDLTINENLRCWETDACAPLTVKPELVKPVWQRIADRAVALGHTAPTHSTTDDAEIHLVVDGTTVRPLVSTDRTVSFMLPATAKSIRLVSRATRQSALMPWLDDPRTLGVAIRSVTLRDKGGESVLGADHPALRDGWHAAERGADGALWRWSTGNAALPLKVETPCMVEITLSDTATYIADARRLAA